ncbi:hypothetical protein MBOT_25950 [Mycobacterium botniense]|uniref:Uncharacterized protein n=1 Tax=Mycobacterium botniense TaxID=84962 RepID=A0A7I9XZN9_9MYCO|nr:hypothetical protein MBOT_25950 [Mycobacterium botniense]
MLGGLNSQTTVSRVDAAGMHYDRIPRAREPTWVHNRHGLLVEIWSRCLGVCRTVEVTVTRFAGDAACVHAVQSSGMPLPEG